ncbi:MAG: hypothetical protein ACRDXB_01810, partial [Actinomycetes bacterium]
PDPAATNPAARSGTPADGRLLMFWFVLMCGWGLTAALIALVWIHTRLDRSLPVGLGIGIVGGLLWPVTFWIAVGAWYYARTARRSGQAPADPADIARQVQQAQAYAHQAEIEGMTASAEYWRAELQRLGAQQQAGPAPRTYPAATGPIVVGCTIASLATVGALWFATPSSEPAPTAARMPSTPFGPVAPAAPADDADPTRTRLGNLAKAYGEVAGVVGNDGHQIAEFTVGAPTEAPCGPYAQDPVNGRFIRLPISLKTYDDPTDQLPLVGFGTWEFVGADGLSLEASTSAATSCTYEVPSQLGPNRLYEFAVVLDVPAAPGALVLNTIFDGGGWEWSYSGS